MATLAFLRSTYGTRATALALSAVISSAWALALLTNRLLPVIEVHAHDAITHETHGVLATGAGGVLVLLLLRSIWLAGTRGWLASLGGLADDHAHHHGHDHDHDHGHAHAHDEGAHHRAHVHHGHVARSGEE